LSRFLLLLLHLRQICFGAKPRHPQLHLIKILYLDNFLPPRQLISRHCASAHLLTFCYRDRFSATYQPCTATRIMLNKICTLTAKTRAIPSLHRDNFLAKVPGPCPVLSSGNTTSLYCRAVRWHSRLSPQKTMCPKENSILTKYSNLFRIL
jgi:hypothetical protein